MSTATNKLVTLFSALGWKRFVEVLASYRNRGKALPASFSITDATDDERRCYMRLLRLKQPPAGAALRCDLNRIATALAQQGIEADWQALLEALCGPVPEELRIQQANQRAWDDFWPWAEAHVAQQTFPLASDWLRSLRGDGSLLRLSKGDAQLAATRLRAACAVLSHLPLADEPLPGAAARLCGNSHALDPDSPLSSLILRNLAMQRSIPMPERSDDRRQLWEHFGIICDDLSAPVLTINLGLIGQSWLCRLIAEAAAESQPLHLTNRMIATADWSAITCPAHVFVCENPTIISLASARLRQRCPPMICVNGEPRSTSRALLRRMRADGSTIWYHGDFDWPGVNIASRMFAELGCQPWLMSANDYEQAILAGKSRVLRGIPIATVWDQTLAQSMKKHQQAVDEEAVFDSLATSLAAAHVWNGKKAK